MRLMRSLFLTHVIPNTVSICTLTCVVGGVRHARSRRSHRGSLESKASKEGTLVVHKRNHIQ